MLSLSTLNLLPSIALDRRCRQARAAQFAGCSITSCLFAGNKKLRRTVALAAVTMLLAAGVRADYNANMSGVVTDVMVYTETDHILFRVNNQPATHPLCNPALFSVDATTTPDRRKAILARLLLAQATREPMNVGYDQSGNCSGGWIRVHRVG